MLDKAVDIARSKITNKQLEAMKSDTTAPPKEEVNLVGKEKGKSFKKQSNDKFKQRKKQKAEPENGKCKNCGTQHKRNECPAYNKRCAYCQKWHHFASVCMAQIQRNQFSKWKIFHLLNPVVINGLPHSASIVNKTSMKPSSNASLTQVQPVMYSVTETSPSSNRSATPQWKAAKQSSNYLTTLR